MLTSSRGLRPRLGRAQVQGKQFYKPQLVEKKWQEIWERAGIYRAVDPPKARCARHLGGPKKYLLIEFPYPSGERLHVGHGRSYCCLDALARLWRMKGFNVLYPIGWDAFGLPAENYALKTGINPAVTTKKNIRNAKKQAKSWGLSFDWSREINTTDREYYKWTQWIFLQLFKKGLAYRQETSVNWCAKCKTNLADEEVLADGSHERCGKKTEKRMQKQWLIKITAYAERLLKDLELVDFREDIKKQQINWIGKKEGIEITYAIEGTREAVTVFTTRPETNFGATFIVLAPEHKLGEKITIAEYKQTVKKYINEAKNRSELERIEKGRMKSGVFTGRYAINQLNGYKMPIWISDFVLASVGSGAVVGVPGHDKRDFEFSRQFGLAVKRVVVGADKDISPIVKAGQVQEKEGIMINSGFLDGLDIDEAAAKMMDYLEKKGWGKRTVSYHLRDWVFSRQHYWGEPIPIIHCQKCGAVPVPEEDLPVKLPYVEKYQPSETGESPLAKVKEWVETDCPQCHRAGRRETDTMPNWAGSNWYYLAYLLAGKLGNWKLEIGNWKLKNIFVDNKNILEYWMPVDLYNGGMEHTTLHLLYSRFIYKFLYDLGVVPGPEPYSRRWSHGVVLGPDGQKMSKSRGNVINPDEIVKDYGADTFRLYEGFMGPFAQMIAWDEKGVRGCWRFLSRVWELMKGEFKDEEPGEGKEREDLWREIYRTTRKVEKDIERLHFNTAIAHLMKLLGKFLKNKERLTKKMAEHYLLLLAPLAPHISEELWQKIRSGKTRIVTRKNAEFISIHRQPWPEYDRKLARREQEVMVVEVDGKLKDKLKIKNEKSKIEKEKIEKMALEMPRVQKHLKGKMIKRVVFVPGKLINFVTKKTI